MGAKAKDISGLKFSYLTAIRPTDKRASDGSILWLCKCVCGSDYYATTSKLAKGDVKSCGCMRASFSREYNRYEFFEDKVRVIDSKGNFAIIDATDFDAIRPYYWFKGRNYFFTVTHRKHLPRLPMHRFIFSQHTPIPQGFDIDHVDRNKTNNSMSNLRLATRAENVINRDLIVSNTSGFTGVSKFKGKYRAYITVNNKQKHLGVFDTPEEAYKSRVEAERKYYGDFSSKGVSEL